jgi:hypothetical protein
VLITVIRMECSKLFIVKNICIQVLLLLWVMGGQPQSLTVIYRMPSGGVYACQSLPMWSACIVQENKRLAVYFQDKNGQIPGSTASGNLCAAAEVFSKAWAQGVGERFVSGGQHCHGDQARNVVPEFTFGV